MPNTVERFTNTVANYVKYRPSYPQETICVLQQYCGLTSNSIVADLGAGTGIFTELLASQAKTIYAVEPNEKMRLAAEETLKNYDNIIFGAGTAEATQLTSQSVDLITMAQAFHWVNPTAAKEEFKRILKPNAWVALIWNVRQNSSSFMQAYEDLLEEFGIDYHQVAVEHNVAYKELEKFFAPNPVQQIVFENQQAADWSGFKGRLLSTSYVPKEQDDNFGAMLLRAEEIFQQEQKNGQVTFIYATKIYLGQV